MATVDQYAINIKVQGADQLTAAGTATDNLGKSINNLPLKSLTDNSGHATDSVSKLHEGMKTLGEKAEALGTAIVGIGLVEFIRNIAEGATVVKDLSEAFGLSVASVLEMESGMARAGRSAESMNKTLYTLSDSALIASEDINGKVMAAFRTLGVTLDDLKTKSTSEVFYKIAQSMEEAHGSAESLAAAVTVAGRSMKGFVAADYIAGFDKAKGGMDDAARGVEAFDTAMKSLEANAMAVKREIMALLAPVAEFLNELTSGTSAAKVEAYALTGAMLALSASLAVKGFAMIADGAKAIAGALGLSTLATNAESVSLAANSAAQGVNAAVRAEGIAARVASLKSTMDSARAHIAEIEALIANNAAMATNVIVTTELFAARRALWVATGQLATQEGLLTEAMVLSGAATATAATETTAAAASTGALAGTLARIGAMFEYVGAVAATFGATVLAIVGIVGAPIWATVAAAIAAIGAALAIVTIAWRAFGDEATAVLKNVWGGIKDFAGGIVDSIDGAVTKISNKLRSLVGLAPKVTGENQSTAEGNRLMSKDKPILGDFKPGNQEAAGAFTMMAQIAAGEQLRQQSKARLQLELDLVGAGEARKAQAMAEFDFYSKRDSEVLRLQNEIQKVTIEQQNAQKGTEGKYNDQLNALNAQLRAVQAQKDLTSNLVGEIKRAEQAEQARLQWLELQKKLKNDIYGIDEQIASLTMTQDQQRLAAINKEMRAEQQAAVARRQAQLGDTPITPAEQESIMKRIADAYDPVIAKQKELNSLSRDFSVGWTKAFNAYVDDGTNAAKMAEQAFTSMTGRMNSAIDNFVDTGKFSFDDFAKSVIQDLIKIELKAQATKLLSAIGNTGGSILSAIGSFLGFADGGEPPVGKPSIVGERGPEIFIPKQAGTVVPMNAAGGGTQQNITNETHNYNISAIDSKSVAQLFAENRKALLGTVQLAQKELPYGNR
jgi:lambda family phage tail tape measure protein